MNKFALLLGIAIALTMTPNQGRALRATAKVPDRLSHNIPAAQTYCLNELFRREGLDEELARSLGIKMEDDPQVLALRRYCQSRQPVGNLPRFWPAPAHRLGRYCKPASHHHHFAHPHYPPTG